MVTEGALEGGDQSQEPLVDSQVEDATQAALLATSQEKIISDGPPVAAVLSADDTADRTLAGDKVGSGTTSATGALAPALPPVAGAEPIAPVLGGHESAGNVKGDSSLTELVAYPKADDSKKPGTQESMRKSSQGSTSDKVLAKGLWGDIAKEAPKLSKIPLD